MQTDMPNYGIPTVEMGGGRYMVVDEEAPLIAAPNRYRGSEMVAHSEPFYYSRKMSMLKNLQVRVLPMYIGPPLWNKDPVLNAWVLRSLGKTPRTSADAWCALREGRDKYQEWSRYNRGFRGEWWVRNFERWLMQREIEPDGRTVAVYEHTSTVPFNEHSREARRTDRAHGQNYIYFNVEDRFFKGAPNRMLLKITYLDNFSGSWWVEYDASDGQAYKRSASVANRGDGVWKTVSLDLPGAAFMGRQAGGMDFRIFCGGSNDITVRFVRLIKRDPPDSLAPVVLLRKISFSGKVSKDLVSLYLNLGATRQPLAIISGGFGPVQVEMDGATQDFLLEGYDAQGHPTIRKVIVRP
jgi:hypothetical protein